MPTHEPFRGSHTVLATPFTADGSTIDTDALRRLINWQIESGSHGLIPLGSTGEFLSVSDDERRVIVETAVDAANGRVPVLIGTADEWTDKAVRYSVEAQDAGADGLMIISPYYSSPTEDELFEHFRRISDAVSIPIMVYNNPNTANVDLRPEFVARLDSLENVRYIKESSGDISRVREIHRISDRVSVFAGYHPFESLAAGAKGYVSVIGNFLPAGVCGSLRPDGRGQARRSAAPVQPHDTAAERHRRRQVCVRNEVRDGGGRHANRQSETAKTRAARSGRGKTARANRRVQARIHDAGCGRGCGLGCID